MTHNQLVAELDFELEEQLTRRELLAETGHEEKDVLEDEGGEYVWDLEESGYKKRYLIF